MPARHQLLGRPVGCVSARSIRALEKRGDAYESLSRADQTVPLGAEDVEFLATSATCSGDLVGPDA